MNNQASFRSAILAFEKKAALDILKSGVDSMGSSEAVEHIVANVLKDIGDDWAKGDLALSQVYMSARLAEEICNELFTESEQDHDNSSLAITTLSDYHVLGKRIMCSVLRTSGYRLRDLGSGRQVEDLVDDICRDNIKYLLISTLMLPSALKVKDLQEALERRKHKVKIMVGGAPFNFDDDLYLRVGADAMGRSAKDAMKWIDAETGDQYRLINENL